MENKLQRFSFISFLFKLSWYESETQLIHYKLIIVH